MLDECGDDLNSAITRLNDLCLASSDADILNDIPNLQTETPGIPPSYLNSAFLSS